jgi:tetratricopeptide (TPR) repeat protein
VAVGLQSLATLLRDVERYADAEPLVREALEINRDVLGSDHPYVSDNLNLLGSVLRGQDRLDEAGRALEEAVSRTRAFRGDDHPDVAVALNTYAGLLLDREDYSGAHELLSEAVDVVRTALGDDHPAVAFNVGRRARADHGLGAHAAEEAATREAIRIFDAAFGEGNLHTALARGALGECLLERGRRDEAEPLLVASEAALAVLHEPSHARVVSARERLARLRGVPSGADRASRTGRGASAPR